MSSSAEILIPQVEETLQIRMGRSPETLIKEASLCAQALGRAVERNGWAKYLGGPKPHLMYEAWAFLAAMYRVTPRIVPGATRLIEIGGVVGFEAEAEAFHIPSQLVISTGNAMCLNDEENWGLRSKYEGKGEQRKKVGEVAVPLFQLRSMAQTRAQAKAMKGPFSWIVAMAGFAPAAAEDAPPGENGGSARAMRQPQQKPAESQKSSDGGPQVISEKQASRIWGIAHTAGKSKEEVLAIIKHFGFESPKDVTIDKYDLICAELQKGDAQ